MKLKQFKQAEDACKKGLEIQSGNTGGLMTLGKALQLQGKRDKALDCYKKVLKQNPDHANAYYRSGRVLYEKKEYEAARVSFENATRSMPNHAKAWHYLAHAMYDLDRIDESEKLYHKALDLKPDHVPAYLDLIFVLNELHKTSEAHALCLDALDLAPGNADVLAILGYTLRESGHPEEAASSYRKAIAIHPDNADFHYRLGQILRELGQTESAAECLGKAIKLNPRKDRYPLALGGLYQATGNYKKALEYFQHTLRIKPDSTAAHTRKGKVMYMQGRHQEAIESFRQALRYKPDSSDINIGLAAALMALSKHEEASEHCMVALRLQPDNTEAAALAAQIAVRKGNVEEAYNLLQPLLEQDTLSDNVIMSFANISTGVGRIHESIRLLEQVLDKNSERPAETLVKLHFSLGKLYDSEGTYDKAFHHFQQGNALKQASFDARQHMMETDAFIAQHTWKFMAGLPHASIRSERPIFIIGMPRSGTTLVEQILSSHPDVYGAGELTNIGEIAESLPAILETQKRFPQCLSLITTAHLDKLAMSYLDTLEKLSPDAKRVTDKMLGFMYLGLIDILFPAARVIHCVRDPMDTCLSGYFQDFSRSHPYAYDLHNLGAYYRGYQKVMHNWKNILHLPIMEVKYEDMVANQEAVSRKLIEFCGLEWDDRCLEFYKNERFVGTASYDQVRRPMYNTSSGRWKNYEQVLDPLKDALRE
jgi:tetratricopeptide (TPR) repeat protein